jgi:hypothetical protein
MLKILFADDYLARVDKPADGTGGHTPPAASGQAGSG